MQGCRIRSYPYINTLDDEFSANKAELNIRINAFAGLAHSAARSANRTERWPTCCSRIDQLCFSCSREKEKGFSDGPHWPGCIIAPVFQATADQTFPLKIGAHPEHGLVPEWSQGFNGYTKRYASRFGMGLIGTTSRYGIGELLHQDVSYHPCQCTGTLRRAFHAITQAFVAHTASGRSVPSSAALISPFLAAEVATVAWYPVRYNASDALRTSTALYLALPIKNLMKEREKR